MACRPMSGGQPCEALYPLAPSLTGGVLSRTASRPGWTALSPQTKQVRCHRAGLPRSARSLWSWKAQSAFRLPSARCQGAGRVHRGVQLQKLPQASAEKIEARCTNRPWTCACACTWSLGSAAHCPPVIQFRIDDGRHGRRRPKEWASLSAGRRSMRAVRRWQPACDHLGPYCRASDSSMFVPAVVGVAEARSAAHAATSSLRAG